MADALLAATCVALAVLVAPAGGPPALRGGPVMESDELSRDSSPWGRREHHALSDADPEPEEVASALVLLALGFRSGLPTSRVLEAVASVMDVQPGDERSCRASDVTADMGAGVSHDLRQVAAALHWGASDVEAWGAVGDVWSGAARAVAIAHRAGLPPGPLLLSAADELRREALEVLELAAERVGVRLVAPLGLVLLPAFCLTTVVPLVVALGRQMLTG